MGREKRRGEKRILRAKKGRAKGGEKSRGRAREEREERTISVTSLHSCDGKLPDHPEPRTASMAPMGL